MRISECDFVFLSYDEPNADLHYADLCNKFPWAKRVHGVKGSDAAHKAAADISETPWVVTVDADNIVDQSFFDVQIDENNIDIQVYSWLSKNKINGLMYGNGGIKLWKTDFINSMKSHEAAISTRTQVDFCWETGYKQVMECFSITDISGSPFQAWRAGFREGVKMTLVDGVKVPPQEIKERVWWHNLHRLKIWSTIGSHELNGIFAILGSRQGTYMSNCTDWDYVQVRDFEHLKNIYNNEVLSIENNLEEINKKIKDYGEKIKVELGLHWADLNPNQSKYIFDLYHETINLTKTYYNRI